MVIITIIIDAIPSKAESPAPCAPPRRVDYTIVVVITVIYIYIERDIVLVVVVYIVV